MKRLLLFLATNLAILMALSLVTNVLIAFFGVDVAKIIGAEYAHLAIFAVVYGFLGSIISLLLSKPIAKFFCGAVTIDGSEGEAERWLVSTVEDLARRANISTPEVAIYEGSANAFATGAFKNSALVAVSSDIMRQMTKEELRAVLGHEISHVANGDMVTLTLIQGVLNTFVLFFSRAAAYILSGGDRRKNNYLAFVIISLVLQFVLGLFAAIIVCAFSRRREYAADSGSAKLLGTPQPMINALRRLGNLEPGVLPDSLKAFGIAEGRKTSLFSTHPSLENRIEALQNWTGI